MTDAEVTAFLNSRDWIKVSDARDMIHEAVSIGAAEQRAEQLRAKPKPLVALTDEQIRDCLDVIDPATR